VLVMSVLQAPVRPGLIVQLDALKWTPVGVEEKVTVSVSGPGFVAVAVAALFELPSATIEGGDNDRLRFVAASAGPASPNQPTTVASTTSPQRIEPRRTVLSGRRRKIRRSTQCLILRKLNYPQHREPARVLRLASRFKALALIAHIFVATTGGSAYDPVAEETILMEMGLMWG
jgi:hypothetical protein